MSSDTTTTTTTTTTKLRHPTDLPSPKPLARRSRHIKPCVAAAWSRRSSVIERFPPPRTLRFAAPPLKTVTTKRHRNSGPRFSSPRLGQSPSESYPTPPPTAARSAQQFLVFASEGLKRREGDQTLAVGKATAQPIYRRHPDKLVRSGVPEAEATTSFQELVKAYEVLSDTQEPSAGRKWRRRLRFEMVVGCEGGGIRAATRRLAATRSLATTTSVPHRLKIGCEIY
ncbi:hypothetical protein CASFOL_003684 [Castilleja foliolosa]|uniref:J domain-containing protein n=1 Tax=Castilleja foliolosa TaxID=1961234 RepID=A0ABD3EI73_9LAMI